MIITFHITRIDVEWDIKNLTTIVYIHEVTLSYHGGT